MGAEDRRHLGEHAGLIGDHHGQVVLRREFVDRTQRRLFGDRQPSRSAVGHVDGGVDEIAEDGGGSRTAAGTAPVEHEIADRGAFDEHGVERIIDVGERVAGGDHRRMHPDGDLAVGALDHGERLDDVAEALGGGDVGGGDRRDALVLHIAGPHIDTEHDRGDDRSLRAGVVALDIGGRIGLGVPERLRIGERVGVVGALLRHLGEDVVGRAVDDAHHPADVFAHERLAQRADQGDAASDGGFEEQVDAVLGGNGVQLRPVRSEEFLVAGDDRLAVLERGADERQRRAGAADELHDDVDIGVSDDRRRIGGEQRRIRQTVLVLGGVADSDRADAQLHSRTGGDGGAAGVEQVDERSADRAAAEKSDGEVGHDAERSRLPQRADSTSAGPTGGERTQQCGLVAPRHHRERRPRLSTDASVAICVAGKQATIATTRPMSLGPVDDRMPGTDRAGGGEPDRGGRFGSPAHDGAHHPVDIEVGSLEEQRKVADLAEQRLGTTERDVQRGMNQVEFGSEREHIDAANLDGDGRCDEFVEIDQMPVGTWRECAVQVEFGAGPSADRDRRREPPLPVGRDLGPAPSCPDGCQG